MTKRHLGLAAVAVVGIVVALGVWWSLPNRVARCDVVSVPVSPDLDLSQFRLELETMVANRSGPAGRAIFRIGNSAKHPG